MAPQRNVEIGWKRRIETCLTNYILRVSSLLFIIIGPAPPHHYISLLTFLLLYIEALSANLSTLSVEAQAKAEKDSAKKAAKAAKAEEVEAQRKALSKVILKRVERVKRKHFIVVTGLEAFGLDLKKVAKEMGKKFACGSSVTKAPGGGEEIVVQGDLSNEIEDWLLGKYKDIPRDNIEQVGLVLSFSIVNSIKSNLTSQVWRFWPFILPVELHNAAGIPVHILEFF